jgi:hypothetical protein
LVLREGPEVPTAAPLETSAVRRILWQLLRAGEVDAERL